VNFKRYLTGLLLLTLLLLLTGFLLITFTGISLNFKDLIILTGCFFSVSLLSLFIFHRGQKREPEGRIMHLLVAISIKMLLEMTLALLWFFVAKKTTTASLLLFFVLYLAFSLLSIFLMLNALKTKSL
jgi:hypothetical protein